MIDLIAFVDVETSGIVRKDASDADQPHILQLSCKVVDGSYRRVSRFTRLIRPDGWSIEPEAFAIHGIDEKLAYQAGVPLWVALTDLKASLEEATVIVAHNMQFERKLIDLSIARTDTGGRWWAQTTQRHQDTMTLAEPILRLPSPITGHSGYKWPSLEEAVNFFAINTLAVDREFPSYHLGQPTGFWQSRHDAEDDIDATEFCYRAIREWKE